MKCIKCGHELSCVDEPRGWQCVNSSCEEYQHSWTLAEHKDNQDWNVRHTRMLEEEVFLLKERLSKLESDMNG